VHYTTDEEKNDPDNDVSNGDKTESTEFLKRSDACRRDEKVDFGEEGE